MFPEEDSWPEIIDPVEGTPSPWPPFVTKEKALERARRVRTGHLHTIRFFPDHSHTWPLWDTDAGYTAAPEDYDLSKELRHRLSAWREEWLSVENALLTYPNTTEKPTHSPDWFREGDRLTRDLAIEVWHIGDVTPAFRAA